MSDLARAEVPTTGPIPVTSGVRRGLLRVGAVVGTAVILTAIMATAARWRERASADDGARLLANGEHRAAVRTLLRALAREPEDARAHYYLGLAYAHFGARLAAIRHLREAVRLTPARPEFHDGLGRAFRRAGDLAAAVAELETAGRLDPRNPRYQLGVAGLLLEQGRSAEAIEHLRAATQLRPQSAEIRLLLATVERRHLGSSAAQADYATVARLAPEDALGEVAREELRAAELTERSVR